MGDPPDQSLLQAELRARRDDASTPLDEAVWCLVLGEPETGLQAIRRHVAAAPDAERRGVLWTQLAVLAGESDQAADAARSALPHLDYVSGYREQIAAQLCLIAGDEEGARRHVEDLGALIEARDRLRSGHPARVTEIPRGLVDRNAGRVAAGVDALLGWHLRRARARSEIFNSARAAINLDAIVALLLAHERGLSVPVAATYRAARLPLLAIHLTAWEGQPLARGTPLSLTVDLVAGSWLRARGLRLDPAPPAPPLKNGKRARRKRTRAADVGTDLVRQSLRLREREGGHPWQLASWA